MAYEDADSFEANKKREILSQYDEEERYAFT
jgi:hypothetical protein